MTKQARDLRTKTPGELQRLLGETQDELVKLRFSLANRQSSNQAGLMRLRRQIARIKTLLREDQLRRMG